MPIYDIAESRSSFRTALQVIFLTIYYLLFHTIFLKTNRKWERANIFKSIKD